MLKYVSANLGLTQSSLSPLMENTHELGLSWFVERDQRGAAKIISHGGGAGGFCSFTGFDTARRRGVVIFAGGCIGDEARDRGASVRLLYFLAEQ